MISHLWLRLRPRCIGGEVNNKTKAYFPDRDETTGWHVQRQAGLVTAVASGILLLGQNAIWLNSIPLVSESLRETLMGFYCVAKKQI